MCNTRSSWHSCNKKYSVACRIKIATVSQVSQGKSSDINLFMLNEFAKYNFFEPG